MKFTPKTPLTLREQMAAGPKFERVEDEEACTACGPWERIDVDRATGLCLECWRSWRWSPVRERETERAHAEQEGSDHE